MAVRYGIAIRIYASRKFWNLAVVRRTAKLPNLIHRQIFRLYGISSHEVLMPLREGGRERDRERDREREGGRKREEKGRERTSTLYVYSHIPHRYLKTR